MRATSLYVLALALAGCSERSERLNRSLDVGASAVVGRYERAFEPVLVRSSASGIPHLRTDTLAWADSTVRGDTTFHSMGRAITTTSVVTDSQWVRVTLRAVLAGVPFGLSGGWSGTQLRANTEAFTLSYAAETPATLLSRIAIARTRGLRMVTAMTGGARANYLTNGVFDMNKWKAKMKAFDTPEIRVAVAEAVSDGVLIGNSVMDEPFNDGGPGNEANSWGPKGTMTKARVDSMCGYARTIFPTLPQGVFQDWRLESRTSYRVCDFITSQYAYRKGPVNQYRDSALALCSRDRHVCAFSINVLDGGIQAPRAPGKTTWAPEDCPLATTGGQGTYFPNCRMTADQVRETGRILGSAGCFLTGFRYDAAFLASPDNLHAIRDVIGTLSVRSRRSCLRQ